MMDIACAADENYVPHCAAMIHSALVTNDPQAITVHFLQGPDVRPTTVGMLRDFVEGMGSALRCYVGLDDSVAEMPVMERIPTVMWYRIFLPQLVPEAHRILYLDCDTLVVDSIAPLWDLQLKDHYVGAVSNVFEPGMDCHATSLGLAPRDYFNSGVMLMNLDLMRDDGCTEAILECARAVSLLWPDQDALNLVLGAKRHSLDPRWNCMNMLFYPSAAADVFGADLAAEAVRRPGVIHFEGPSLAKPWHYLNRHPWRQEYFNHRRATPWPEVAITERTAQNRVLRLLPSRAAVGVLRFEQRVRQRLDARTQAR